jgi:hypothetical protein
MWMWMTYLAGVHDNSEEVVGEQHRGVPAGHDEGASIPGLVGWVKHSSMIALAVLLTLRAPLRLRGHLADTKRNADLVSEGGGDVGRAGNEVLPLLVHLVGIALAELCVTHRTHADDIDHLAVAEGVVGPVVVPVAPAVTCAHVVDGVTEV